MKFSMSFTPLSLSEVHRRRANRLLAISSRPELLSNADRDENAEDIEELA